MNDLAFIKARTPAFPELKEWALTGFELYLKLLDPEDLSDTSSFREWYSKISDQESEGPAANLIRIQKYSAPEIFILFLAGLAESDAAVSFQLAELHQPGHTGYLSVHLATDIAQALFPESAYWDALDIESSELIEQEILTLEGEGPLPLQSLKINRNFWSLLRGSERAWPGCCFINPGQRDLLPDSVKTTLPRLSSDLNDHQSIILRGQLHSGRSILAAEIAKLLGLKAIKANSKQWNEDPSFRIASELAEWVVVTSAAPSPGESTLIRPPGGDQKLIVITGEYASISGTRGVDVHISVPAQDQRLRLWQQGLKDTEIARDMAAHARLSGPTIRELTKKLAEQYTHGEDTNYRDIIRSLRNHVSTSSMSQLAHLITRSVPEGAVVFPPLITSQIHELIHRARNRESLWSSLGSSMKATENTGVRALFVGDSGTGKTLAASYIASQLAAPLYRVDLGAVMNKYIGESEKNLGRLLDEAAAADCVLLFDEADSVFGTRTDPRSSGERFANNLTNYLLSRIESHPGIVILTTNHKDRIDPAFNRRLEIIIDFPLPGFNERLALWKSHLGDRSPDDNILRSLASHTDLAGGQIRNAVLTAAAHQAGQTGAISAAVLITAISREYQKLGRSLPAALQNLGGEHGI